MHRKDHSFTALLGAVFAAGFSMPLSRACIVLSLAILLWRRGAAPKPAAEDGAPDAPRAKARLLSAPFAGFLVYFAVALVFSIIAAATNTDSLLAPAKGLGKIDKLAWYAFIPLGAWHLRTAGRMDAALKAFVCGCLVTALIVIFYNPAAAWFQVTAPHPKYADSALTPVQIMLRRAVGLFGDTAMNSVFDWIRAGGYQARTFSAALAKLGTMQDSQRLMAALPAALCLPRAAGGRRFGRTLRLCAPPVLLLALALTLKRGPLIFGMAAVAALGLRRAGWRALLLPAAMALAVALLPAARGRFAALPQEFMLSKGGRAVMWTQIAPALRRERPWGVGFRALTNEKMREISPHVEARQTHLHSVPVQSWVDFGWAGLAAWLLWMWLSLRAAWRCAHPAPFAMLSALAGYGLMEYNIADGEVVLLYALAMALSAAAPARALIRPRQRG